MELLLKKIFKVTLLYWVAAAVAMSFFLFKVTPQNYHLSEEKSFYKKVLSAFSMPRINLGMDLSGGSRIIYKVDVDKSIQVRFSEVIKDFEKLLRRKKVLLPHKKSFVGETLFLNFLTSEQAQNAHKALSFAYSAEEYKFKVEGTDVHVELSEIEKQSIREGATDKAVTILRTRLDTINVKGLSIFKHGSAKIIVNLPVMDEEEFQSIKANAARSAKLEFKIVEDEASSKAALLKKFGGVLPPDKMIIAHKDNSLDSEFGQYFLVSIFSDVLGKNIANASVGYDQFSGKPMIDFKMNSTGAIQMQEATSKNIGKRLAIIMDEKVVQAPVVNGPISGHGSITSENFKIEEVSSMVALLKAGALDAPLTQESESRVGAALGKDSIERGLLACLLSLLFLFIFSIFWYKTAGLFAVFALIYNLLIIFVAMAYLKATLTLPGIAGLILTLGMAIDSSILIYQAIKEALDKGSSLQDAINIGFSDAISVILDSNVTTFIAGMVLYFFGGPLVRGFAVTLMLGIFATVVAGCFFLRSIFDFCTNVLGFKKISI